MKAVAMVAHPDDCVIFAYSFMHHHKQFNWTVCYLTYTTESERGQEFVNFWKVRGVNTKFLGFVDDYHDIENDQISFDTGLATTAIKESIKDYDLVLTHDHKGDYGHLHHKFVHQVVRDNHTYMVCFASIGQGNVKYTVEPGAYELEEFLMHKDIVSSFHKERHVNEYTVTDRVNNIL
jgi:hypothetical protein